MRLHLNENTAGCSPAVIDVLRQLGRPEAGLYPDYTDAVQAVAAQFRVPADYVLLTNGLDEGILAACAAAFRERTAEIPEAVGVAPAFDMYEGCTTALGGRMISVPLPHDFQHSTGPILEAITSQTRVVFLANPHNPSGTQVPRESLTHLARWIAPVMLFVDEAYADFSGETVIDRGLFEEIPSLIAGRTFSKAYGLAGLRIGAVLGNPATLAALRAVVPPYSVNGFAAVALPVAIGDRAYRDWYIAQAQESRAILADACRRLALQTWPSAANFVLVRVGPAITRIVAALAAKGIRVRDRSAEPGCEFCIRITAGIVEDTRRVVKALEEAVCDARR